MLHVTGLNRLRSAYGVHKMTHGVTVFVRARLTSTCIFGEKCRPLSHKIGRRASITFFFFLTHLPVIAGHKTHTKSSKKTARLQERSRFSRPRRRPMFAKTARFRENPRVSRKPDVFALSRPLPPHHRGRDTRLGSTEGLAVLCVNLTFAASAR